MPNPSSAALESLLTHSADPLALVTDTGAISWSNEAWGRLAGMKSSLLQEVVTPETAQKILSTPHFSVGSTTLSSNPGDPLGSDNNLRTVLAVEIPSGRSVAGKFLVFLLATDNPEQRHTFDSELLSTIAHDIKNPIGAVLGYTDALLDTSIGAKLEERPRQLIRRIRTAATRAIELIRNYHHLSRLQYSETPPPTRSERSSLGRVTRDVVDQLARPGSDQAPIALSGEDAEILVSMERSQLDRVVSNLVANALLYSPANALISIRLRSLKEHGEFQIRNTGSSIPASEMAALFRPFQRPGSTSRPFQRSSLGTGLGLYIVRQLVERAGGTVTAESSEKDGTSFRITLPLARTVGVSALATK